MSTSRLVQFLRVFRSSFHRAIVLRQIAIWLFSPSSFVKRNTVHWVVRTKAKKQAKVVTTGWDDTCVQTEAAHASVRTVIGVLYGITWLVRRGWLCQSWDYNSALSASSRTNASLPGRVTDPTSLFPPRCPVTCCSTLENHAFHRGISFSRYSSPLLDERSSRRSFIPFNRK